MSDQPTFSGERKGHIREREIVKEVPIKEKETIVKEVPSHEKKLGSTYSTVPSGQQGQETTLRGTEEQTWGEWLRSYVPGTKEYAWSKDVSELQKINEKFSQLPLEVVQSPDFARDKQLFESANRRAVYELKIMEDSSKRMNESERNSPMYQKAYEDFNAAQLREKEAMTDVQRFFDCLNSSIKHVESKRSELKKQEKDKPESALLSEHQRMGAGQHVGTVPGQDLGASNISGQQPHLGTSNIGTGQQQFGTLGSSSISREQQAGIAPGQTRPFESSTLSGQPQQQQGSNLGGQRRTME